MKRRDNVMLIFQSNYFAFGGALFDEMMLGRRCPPRNRDEEPQ